MKKYSTSFLRLLLTHLREINIRNPNQAKRRAAYLKQVKLLAVKGRATIYMTHKGVDDDGMDK